LPCKTEVSAVLFCPDGEHILTGGFDGAIVAWNVQTGAEVKRFNSTAVVHALALSPDGQRVAGAYGDGIVRLWALSNPMAPVQMNGKSNIRSLAFSPSGARIVVGNLDGHAMIYPVATRTREPAGGAPDPPRLMSAGEAIRLDLTTETIGAQFKTPYGAISIVDGGLKLEPGAVLDTVREVDTTKTPVEISMLVKLLTEHDGIRVCTRSSGDKDSPLLLPANCVVAGAFGIRHGPPNNVQFGVVANGVLGPVRFFDSQCGSVFDFKVRDDGDFVTVWVNGAKIYEQLCGVRFGRNFISISSGQYGGGVLIRDLVIRTFPPSERQGNGEMKKAN